jgi:hypothetical protein
MSRLAHPVLVQRVEAGVLFMATLVIFPVVGGPWWLYALLFLTPDVFMLGYLKNARWGAYIYNAGHSLALPILLGLAGLLLANSLYLHLSLIWLGHIGLDRMLGYGLKDTSTFTDTHLGR